MTKAIEIFNSFVRSVLLVFEFFGLNGKRGVILIPYIWLFIFFLIPFFFILKISLSEPQIAIPPYTDIFTWNEEGVLQIKLNFGNYLFLFEDELYFLAYLNSVKVALISTFLCLLIGYPIAYGIAKTSPKKRNILLMLVILPFWTSFLLRVYAWMGILKNNGVINNMLIAIGVIDEPIVMMQTDFAVYVGIVYTYLPFMILPLYTALEKLDVALLEAAMDLGCKPVVTFFKVTLPLTIPGIVAGSLLVFIPAVGEFVIPALLGGADTLMIGRVLWDEFFGNRDWPIASAVAVLMLMLLVIPVMIFYANQSKEARR